MPGTRAFAHTVLLSRHPTLVCINCGVGALETRIPVRIGEVCRAALRFLGHTSLNGFKNPGFDASPTEDLAMACASDAHTCKSVGIA